MRSRRGTFLVGSVVALALLVLGGALWGGETEFGWFAYAPVPDDVLYNMVIVTPRRRLALILATVGVLGLGFVAGFTIGRRPAKGQAE